MTLVRQSAKREKLPDVLELDELKNVACRACEPGPCAGLSDRCHGIKGI